QRLGAEEGDTPVEQQPAAMQDFDPTYDRCGSFFTLDPPSTRLLSVCCSFNSGRQCDETAPTLRAKAALGGQLSAPPLRDDFERCPIRQDRHSAGWRRRPAWRSKRSPVAPKRRICPSAEKRIGQRGR